MYIGGGFRSAAVAGPIASARSAAVPSNRLIIVPPTIVAYLVRFTINGILLGDISVTVNGNASQSMVGGIIVVRDHSGPPLA